MDYVTYSFKRIGHGYVILAFSREQSAAVTVDEADPAQLVAQLNASQVPVGIFLKQFLDI